MPKIIAFIIRKQIKLRIDRVDPIRLIVTMITKIEGQKILNKEIGQMTSLQMITGKIIKKIVTNQVKVMMLTINS